MLVCREVGGEVGRWRRLCQRLSLRYPLEFPVPGRGRSLYEQKLQISQVTVSAFYVDGNESGNLAIEKTGKSMKDLAIDYSIPLA